MAFFCLIGTVYFKEHATGFDTPPPATHFSKFINSTSTTIQKHITWLDIWQNIWDRLSCESDMIPSVDALWRHWKRACWVMDMWHQAEVNVLEVKPIIDYGWMISEGNLIIEWDSNDNIQAIQQQIRQMCQRLQMCHWMLDCSLWRKKKGQQCSIGCSCTNCISITE